MHWEKKDIQLGQQMRKEQSPRLAVACEDWRLEITCVICEEMDRQGITKKELAGRLLMPQSYLTKILDGQTALIPEQIAIILYHLGKRPRLSLEALDKFVPSF